MNKTVLFYDCESTKLVEYKLPSNHADQPYITQLAAELCDEESGEVISTLNHLILPCGWTIPSDVAELTGITTERALAEGVAVELVLDSFIGMWTGVDQRIGHHENFDARIIRIALMRNSSFSRKHIGDLSFADHWKAGAAFCTQGGSTKIVNAARPAGEQKKTASLAEAYKHFTGKDLEGAHDAMNDVRACKAVYYGIKHHHAQVLA